MLSNYLGNKILDLVLGGVALVPPDNVELALFTEMPTAAGGGTEVTGGAYAPVVIANTLTNFPAAADKQKTNGTDLSFPAPSGSWTEITGMVIRDADTGDLLMFAEFVAPFSAPVGYPLEFPAGSLTFKAFN